MIKKLTRLQGQVNKFTKDANNPFFKSRYTTLDAILSDLIPALQEEGIFLTQQCELFEGQWYLETFVWDSVDGGDRIALGKVPLINTKGDAQGMGSAISYARRYGLQCALGLWASDDDGELACGRETKVEPARAPAPRKPAPKPVEKLCNPEPPVNEAPPPSDDYVPFAPAPEPKKPVDNKEEEKPSVPLMPTIMERPLTETKKYDPAKEKFDYKNAGHRQMIPAAMRAANLNPRQVQTVRLAFERGYCEKAPFNLDPEALTQAMNAIIDAGEK